MRKSSICPVSRRSTQARTRRTVCLNVLRGRYPAYASWLFKNASFARHVQAALSSVVMRRRVACESRVRIARCVEVKSRRRLKQDMPASARLRRHVAPRYAQSAQRRSRAPECAPTARERRLRECEFARKRFRVVVTIVLRVRVPRPACLPPVHCPPARLPPRPRLDT